MKVIVYLIENQTSKAYFPITKILCKKDFTYLAYMNRSPNFHQKDSVTLLFRFSERSLLQTLQFSRLFFSMSTVFLVSSISLYSVYAIDLNKINK